MGLFGSLFTGVSALFAQSQSTAIISNNIANVNTTGFKRSEAAFNSLVTTESRLARYSPGTVSVNRIQRVDQQGSIQQTSSGTDGSIAGNGFFPVKRSTDASQPFLYTRAGQFSEDAQGLLRNASGFVLYAWPIDADGNLPANQGDLTSLVQADVAFLGGLTRPTTSAELAINLNASQTRAQYTDLGAGPSPAPQGVSANGAAHFTRGLTVFDSLGGGQTLTLEFHHVYPPTVVSISGTSVILDRNTDLALVPGIADGDRFTIDNTTTGTGPFIFEYDNNAAVGGGAVGYRTVGELIDAINTNFPGEVEARINETGDLVIESVNRADTISLTNTVGTPLTDLTMSQIGAALTAPNLPPGNTDTVLSNSEEIFPDFQDLTTANTQGWWQVVVRHPNGSEITRGLLNFNTDGSLNASADVNGNTDIQIPDVNWGNGSSLQTIGIDVSRFSQFTGNFDVIFSDQNGAELGLRTGVELTREGIVVARFSNGASADLYKIPLITFANESGLTEVSGTAYSESEESGEENLREAGTGGAGFVEPSTLEASNVDLADEFARLIISQRAFGAATKVITTVDQMTEDLLRLR
ncbi:MAG: flagellar hook-basal body complex protein [Alphaproteobacteria bacterium PRO2]|nr:flagellar hook-basal body complex protein [Alphaproteobacteria bacterium PRO2]